MSRPNRKEIRETLYSYLLAHAHLERTHLSPLPVPLFRREQAIPHTASAVAVAQYTAGFLVSEARKSKHSFTDEDLQSYIIWNYSPTFSGKNNASGFDQSYFFNYKA